MLFTVGCKVVSHPIVELFVIGVLDLIIILSTSEVFTQSKEFGDHFLTKLFSSIVDKGVWDERNLGVHIHDYSQRELFRAYWADFESIVMH